MRRLILILLLLSPFIAFAGESIQFLKWQADLGDNTNEAYTLADSKTSFGLFCAGEQCLFYLRPSLICTPGEKYSVLMNSSSISTAVSIECTLIRGNLFQILTPFNAILQATQSGEGIGFAVALQSGAFAVTHFSLLGSKLAIDRVLSEAANSGLKSQKRMPETPLQNFNPNTGPRKPSIQPSKDIAI